MGYEKIVTEEYINKLFSSLEDKIQSLQTTLVYDTVPTEGSEHVIKSADAYEFAKQYAQQELEKLLNSTY